MKLSPNRPSLDFASCSGNRSWLRADTGGLAAAFTLVALLGCIAVVMSKTSLSSANAVCRAESLARLSDEITVHSARRGNPWISMSDGHDVLTSYAGPDHLVRALEEDRAHPLSLASADLDEDGVPDLISGYALPDGPGIITLHRGNVDSIYPNAPEAKRRKAEGTFTESPFLSPARVFALPVAPDFIGTGDFDGDGHWDVVAAARGDSALYFLLGDGHGELGGVRRISLPGFATAMAVGEINRPDGLNDIVVAVSGREGASVMVFGGPDGALFSTPEVLQMPAEVNSLALGRFASGSTMDLAVAAGRQVCIVEGHDRKPSHDKGQQAITREARIVASHAFAHVIRGIAIRIPNGAETSGLNVLEDNGTLSELELEGMGYESQRFVGGMRHRRQFLRQLGCWPQATGLYTIRLSSVCDQILLLDSTARELKVITENPDPTSSQIQTSKRKILAPSTIDIPVQDCPIAVVPMRLNSDSLSDLVILRKNHHTPAVTLTAAGATFTVTNTEDSGPGSLRDAINQANQNAGPDLISFNIPGSGPFVIRPSQALPAISENLTIDGTTQPGFAGSPLVEVDGSNLASDQAALFISGGGSDVRGLILSAAAVNIELTMGGGNIIEGNFIGTSNDGETSAGARGVGLEIIDSSGNTIGGTTNQGRNIISGNGHQGIIVEKSNANVIEGNYVGTNKEGTAILANLDNGVDLSGTANTVIGGTVAGARNVISGNSADGINIFGGMGDLIEGNLIGTDSTGASGLGNSGYGVVVVNSSENIGGTTAAAANVISANGIPGQGSAGIGIIGGARGAQSGNRIQGNLIGTDATGTLPLGNKGSGIAACDQVDTDIGGAANGAPNVISSNTENGIAIGVAQQGTKGSTGFLVEGNFIGTDVTSRLNLGNGLCGIFVDGDSVLDRITSNVIAFNGTNGICIPDNPANGGAPGVKITMLSNLIFSNAQLGIDLGPAGVNPVLPNQSLGAGQANDLQNFPEISSATVSPGSAAGERINAADSSITITGVVPGALPSTTYLLEFFLNGNCDSAGGHQSLGFLPIDLGQGSFTTDSSGGGAFTFTFSVPSGSSAPEGFVNGTATDPVGNTSEFSLCATVTSSSLPNPSISSVTRSGKNLLVAGENFDSGAVILENGADQKTSPDPQNPTTNLTGKKLYKKISPGSTVTIQVRNSSGLLSNQVSYTRPG